MKPLYTLTRNTNVGIYDNCEFVARIYKDKIITCTPYVRWVGNTGGYAERKDAIRDQKIIDAVLADMADDAEDSALDRINQYLY